MSALWRHADFLRLWSALTISVLGSQITLFVAPVITLFVLDASVVEAGLVTACGYLPFLLISLPVGALVDRWPIRPLLIAADLGRAAALAAIPIAYATGALSLPLVCAVQLVHGALTVVADAAHLAFLPALVARDQLLDGNTKLGVSYSAGELAGPGLGGLLVKLVGAPFALLADAASFVVSALLLAGIRGGRRSVARTPHESLGQQIRAGVRYVARHPVIRPLVACMAGANFFDLYGMVSIVLPAFALRDLGLPPARLGLAFSAANLGALLALALNQRVVQRIGIGAVLLISSLLPGAGVLVLASATPAHALPALIAGLSLALFGSTMFNVNQMSLRQQVTPLELQGRMNATVRFAIWGMIPIGAAAGGALADAVGTRPALIVAGAGSLLASLPIWLSRRRLDARPEEAT